MRIGFGGKNVWAKKICVTVFVLLYLFVFGTSEAYAANAIKEPSDFTYADKAKWANEDYYSSYSLCGGREQKVLFGHVKDNPSVSQSWYIAGYEQDGLVLICDPTQPLANDFQFDLQACDLYRTKADFALVTYLKGEALTEHFTEEELARIKSVNCLDNSHTAVYRDVKLYPATSGKRSEFDEYEWDLHKDIFVGRKNQFRISLSPGNIFDTGEEFWLCDTYISYFSFPGYIESALLAIPGANISHDVVTAQKAVVPACHIDMTSVLFASLAPAVTAGDTCTDLNSDETMTLRFDSAKDEAGNTTDEKISAKVDIDYDGLSVSDAKEGEYLYVQWRQNGIDKYYSCKAVNGTISAEAIGGSGFGLTKNCKVWVEKQENEGGIVYAKNAGYETYIVKRGDNLTKIAKELDTSVKDLVIINSIKDPDIIWVDQFLCY